jgi:RimJ/RimL family protein N-acetyltransferase
MIETSRLSLRPIEVADLEDLVALLSDSEVTRFVPSVGRADADAEAAIRAAEREWSERGHGMVAVLERGSARFLGRAGLKYWARFDETEAGWMLRRDVWGRGYATEAGRACVEWGFANLAVPYLTAMIQPANQQSIRVAARLGFAPMRDHVLNGDSVTVYARRR